LFLVRDVQGLNTEIMPDDLLTSGRLRAIDTNEFLQSKTRPEIFAIGVNGTNEGFSAALLGNQAKSVVKNVNLFLKKSPLVPHKMPSALKDLNWGTVPPSIKLGSGEGGYLIFTNLPFPMSCMLTCCGAPFCLPPCCYPCCGGWGVRGFFGWCCGAPAGFSVMTGYLACCGVGGVKKFPPSNGMKGMGQA
jgi:hypothetical protein